MPLMMALLLLLSVTPLLSLPGMAAAGAVCPLGEEGRGLFSSMAMWGRDTDAGRAGSDMDASRGSFFLVLVCERV